jgi:hypothetical protein
MSTISWLMQLATPLLLIIVAFAVLFKRETS